jgi:hypothetical protein
VDGLFVLEKDTSICIYQIHLQAFSSLHFWLLSTICQEIVCESIQAVKKRFPYLIFGKQDDGVADLLDENVIAGEIELFGKSDGLASAVLE